MRRASTRVGLARATAAAARQHEKQMHSLYLQKKKETSHAKYTARRQKEAAEKASAAANDAELNVAAAETAEREAGTMHKLAREQRLTVEEKSLVCRFESGAPRLVAVLGTGGDVPLSSQLEEVRGLGCLREEKEHYIGVMEEELTCNMVYVDRHTHLCRVWGFDQDPPADEPAGDPVADEPVGDPADESTPAAEGLQQLSDDEEKTQHCRCFNQMCNCRGQFVEQSQTQRGSQNSMSLGVSGHSGSKRSRCNEDDDDDDGESGGDSEDEKVMCAQPAGVDDSHDALNVPSTQDVFVVQIHSQNLSLDPHADVGMCFYCQRMITQDEGHCTMDHVCAADGVWVYCKKRMMAHNDLRYIKKHVCHPHCDLHFRRNALDNATDTTQKAPLNDSLKRRHGYKVANDNIAVMEKENSELFAESMRL